MALSRKAVEGLARKQQLPVEQVLKLLEKEMAGPPPTTDLLYVPYRMGTTLLRSMCHASRFFREIRDRGVFYAGRCPRCGYTVLPPQRPVCHRCIKQGVYVEYEYKELGPVIEGACVSWSQLIRGSSKQGELLKSCPSFVKVDGCDNAHWQIVHPAEGKEIKIGARVRSVLRPPEDRTGEISDYYFELV